MTSLYSRPPRRRPCASTLVFPFSSSGMRSSSTPATYSTPLTLYFWPSMTFSSAPRGSRFRTSGCFLRPRPEGVSTSSPRSARSRRTLSHRARAAAAAAPFTLNPPRPPVPGSFLYDLSSSSSLFFLPRPRPRRTTGVDSEPFCSSTARVSLRHRYVTVTYPHLHPRHHLPHHHLLPLLLVLALPPPLARRHPWGSPCS